MSERKRAIEVDVVRAFVCDGTGGNPAAVVLDADDLSETDMQEIAAEVGLSETAFVSASETEGFKLDFFTPNRRIAHCGHATIGTFALLAAQGRVGRDTTTSKETVDGPRRIEMRDGAAFMEQLAPKYAGPADWESAGVTQDSVLASLGITSDSLISGTVPTVVNTGNSFMLVGVRNQGMLARIKPDQAAVEAISNRFDLIGYYVFVQHPDESRFAASARMFGPRYAIPEEAATGMAAGPLACYLHDRLGVDRDRILIEQGAHMKPASPSLLDARLARKNGKILSLMVGGNGVVDRKIRVAL